MTERESSRADNAEVKGNRVRIARFLGVAGSALAAGIFVGNFSMDFGAAADRDAYMRRQLAYERCADEVLARTGVDNAMVYIREPQDIVAKLTRDCEAEPDSTGVILLQPAAEYSVKAQERAETIATIDPKDKLPSGIAFGCVAALAAGGTAWRLTERWTGNGSSNIDHS